MALGLSIQMRLARGRQLVCPGIVMAFCLLLLASRGAAALAWDTLAIDRIAGLGTSSMEVVFHFRNSGDAPVIITSVQTSCGCTSVALDKGNYSPGQTGELKVTYYFAGQVGRQEKTVSVTTSDAPDRPTVLALRVKIPELVSVFPRLLWWSVGESPSEKQTAIVVDPAIRAVVTALSSTNTEIKIQLVPRSGTNDYVLSIKPTSTNSTLRATVKLRIDTPGLAPQFVTVFAQVR